YIFSSNTMRYPPSAEKHVHIFESLRLFRERGFPGVSISTGCAISGLVVDVRQEPKARAPFTRLLKAFVEKIASRFPSRSKDAARGDSIRMISSLVGALILSRAVD